MKTQILVAVCIIEKEKLLLLKQSQTSAQPGKWAPPAGHVEKTENPASGALRELKEETGLTTRLIGVIECDLLTISDGREYLVIFYEAERDSGQEIKVDGKENTEYVWASKDEIIKGVYPLRDDFMKSVLTKSFEKNFAPLDIFKTHSLNLYAKK